MVPAFSIHALAFVSQRVPARQMKMCEGQVIIKISVRGIDITLYKIKASKQDNIQ